jgi:NAD(P)-dependent dehydrogenase (short-subunit alcohol dehydrogenase family)
MNRQNLNVVIFGVSTETGKKAAIELAKKGHKIALASGQKEHLDDVARQCRAYGAETFDYQINTSMQNEVDEFAKQVHKKFGSIDVWINNASDPVASVQKPTGDLNKEQDAGVFGYFYGARAALGYFQQQSYGKLINVFSHVEDKGKPFSMANSTSHSAIREMTSQLQQEVFDFDDIHVTLVSTNSLNVSGGEPEDAGMLVQILEQVDSLIQHDDNAMDEKVPNYFKIGVIIAGMLVGAAAMWYLKKNYPAMDISRFRSFLNKPLAA